MALLGNQNFALNREKRFLLPTSLKFRAFLETHENIEIICLFSFYVAPNMVLC